VKVGFEYDENDPSQHQRSGGDGDGVPGAADGVYGSGSRGGLTWFGEGGEPELDGPRSFMAGVLADAMRANGGAGGGFTIQSSHVYIDGRKVGEITYKQVPLEARRRGVLR
jgi:hypothetical protein